MKHLEKTIIIVILILVLGIIWWSIKFFNEESRIEPINLSPEYVIPYSDDLGKG